jgi:hypothetical protein
MAKSQKRSNREIRKPKAAKGKPAWCWCRRARRYWPQRASRKASTETISRHDRFAIAFIGNAAAALWHSNLYHRP